MSERRYDEDETAAIFARATESQPTGTRALRSGEGMTLAQLQEIGREAGISPDQVAAAARALDRPAPPAPSRFLGVTVGVARTVELDHRMSNDEWERLVVLLRDTFQARGTVRVDGSLRQWTNGNLQVLVEPTERGDRVRLRTRNGNAQGLMTVGAGLLATAGISLLVGLAEGALAGSAGTAALLGTGGLGAIGAALVRLRGWAPTRAEQMEGIADRLEASTTTPRLER